MIRIPPRIRYLVTALICMLFPITLVAADAQTEEWAMKLIPLPKNFKVVESSFWSADKITLRRPDSQDVRIAAALELLQPFAKGSTGFEIKLILTIEQKACPEKLRKALAALPNHDQAYTIEPVISSGKFSGLLLVAESPLGLLYASRTLRQLLASASGGQPIEIPHVTILDWPDLSERGEWGWNLAQDRYSIAELKMNEIEIHSTLGFNPDGSPSATLDQHFLTESRRIGIKVVPIIRHLEQLSSTGLFTYHPKVAAVPAPNQLLASDFQPAVCFSNPQSIELIAGWMKQLLAYSEVDDINTWLSESPAPCFCDRCLGHNPFELETKSLVRAFEIAGQDHPQSHLRILLSQASYRDNDKVLAAITPRTRITYYSGQTTYDSSHEPMIYPLLESFSRNGHWLGVYPQLTCSWRTIFPFTGPHFIKARMTEFVNKGLQGFSGYATPANRYYDFNIAAAAEWSWNSSGRTERQFAEAYAKRIGLKQPQQFAEWVELIGRTGWHLAGSRIVESLVFSAGEQIFVDGFIEDGVLFSKDKPLEFGKGLLAEFATGEILNAHIANAERALMLANKVDEPVMLLESHCVLNTLLLVKNLKLFIDEYRHPSFTNRTIELQKRLDGLDAIAKKLSVAMLRWGHLVNPAERETLHSRFRDSVDFASTLAGQLREWVADSRIADPFPMHRFQRIAQWQSEDFAATTDIAVWADITDQVKMAGEYDLRLFLLQGASGVSAKAVTLLSGPTRETALPVFTDRWEGRLSRYGRYTEYWINIPEKPCNLANAFDHYFIKAEISGPSLDLPRERRTTQGEILIRKSWRDGDLSAQ